MLHNKKLKGCYKINIFPPEKTSRRETSFFAYPLFPFSFSQFADMKIRSHHYSPSSPLLFHFPFSLLFLRLFPWLGTIRCVFFFSFLFLDQCTVVEGKVGDYYFEGRGGAGGGERRRKWEYSFSVSQSGARKWEREQRYPQVTFQKYWNRKVYTWRTHNFYSGKQVVTW